MAEGGIKHQMTASMKQKSRFMDVINEHLNPKQVATQVNSINQWWTEKGPS